MKQYTKPEIEIVRFEAEDVILLSGTSTKSPKSTIGEEEATGIGARSYENYIW